MWKGDSLTPEYIAINPTKTVPALVDGDLNVFDSSAISIHLVEKYAKDDSLYPKDLNLRAKVSERLFYVACYIFPRLYQILVPMYIRGATEANQVQLDEMLRGYGEIESFLNGRDYLASNTLTLPDLYLWSIMESLLPLIPIDSEKFPKFDRWLTRMRQDPSSEFNRKGADEHIAAYQSSITENKKQAEVK